MHLFVCVQWVSDLGIIAFPPGFAKSDIVMTGFLYGFVISLNHVLRRGARACRLLPFRHLHHPWILTVQTAATRSVLVDFEIHRYFTDKQRMAQRDQIGCFLPPRIPAITPQPPEHLPFGLSPAIIRSMISGVSRILPAARASLSVFFFIRNIDGNRTAVFVQMAQLHLTSQGSSSDRNCEKVSKIVIIDAILLLLRTVFNTVVVV